MEKEKVRLGTVAFTPKGKWDAETEYKRLNVVHFLASSYYAKQDNVGQTPSLDSEYWGLLVEGGDVTNNPDEEDITEVVENDAHVLKLADRDYNPDNFSGKGHKILRKNVKNIDLAVTKVTVNSVPTADGEISITINNVDSHITLSKDTHNTTAMAATAISEALATDHEDYDVVAEENVITLTRKHSGTVEASAYDVNETGMTLALEDSTKRVKRSILTSTMMSQSDTIYEIRYDFDLDGETLNVPDNCVLKFDGGSINNGKINLNGCKIKDGKITAFPTSAPYQDTFYTSDFCISKDSDPHFNTLMAQAILDIEFTTAIFDIDGKVCFDGELHWKNSDIYGYPNKMNLILKGLNFPNSRGIVVDGWTIARRTLRNLSITALKDAVSISSGYILYFDSLYVHSKEGSCFVGNIGTHLFECHFNNITVDTANGKYGFDHFCGNTMTWENINISNAGISAFNYCCGSITGCNGCWGSTPHFLTYDSSEFNDGVSYTISMSLRQCNIESYTDVLFDMTDKTVGQVFLWLGENVSLYNTSLVDGKLTKPYIRGNNVNIISHSNTFVYNESKWAEGVYPIMTSILNNNLGSIQSIGDLDIYDKRNKKLYSIRTRNTLFNSMHLTAYYSEVFDIKRGNNRNIELDRMILKRLYVEPKKISYPSDKGVIQLHLGEYQSFELTRPTDEDVEETKVVQLDESYLTEDNDTQILYGQKRKFYDFLTVYNACKKTSFLIKSEEYFGIGHPTIAPGECCTFENINGSYILHSVNKYRHIRSVKSMNTSDGAPSVNGMAIYCSELKKFGISNDGKWLDVFGNPITTKYANPTVNRPTNIVMGTCYFDATLGKPIWWNGSAWIDKDGNPADAKQSGTTENRPTGIKVGFIYKDTTLNKLIIWNGSTWVNMDGSSLDAATQSDETSKEVADDSTSTNEEDTAVVNEENATETENEVTEDPT